jgi:hypothetical protein
VALDRATESAGSRVVTAASLLVAPALIVAGIITWTISDRLLLIGPFDRAQVGWAVVVPLFMFAPGAAGIATIRAGRRAGTLMIAAVAIGVGAALLASLAAVPRQIGCELVSDPIAIAGRTLPIAITAGGSFAVAATIAAGAASRGRPAAIVTGFLAGLAGGAVTLLVFAATFPGVTCVPRPT